MALSKEIDERYVDGCVGEDEIVCPHCGYRFGEDSYFQHEDGYSGRGFEVTCDEDGCGKSFFVEPDYTTSYTSLKYKEHSNVGIGSDTRSENQTQV